MTQLSLVIGAATHLRYSITAIAFLLEAAMRHFVKQIDNRFDQGNRRLGFCARVSLSLLLGLLIAEHPVFAQTPATPPRGSGATSAKAKPEPKKSAPKNTVIEFELLRADGGGGAVAQNWVKVLEPYDISLRVHRPNSGDKPELKEREAGNTRFVTAIGVLDRAGDIVFPNKTLSLSEPVKLKEWIDELKTYGIKGTPKGQPLWGMSEEKFASLFDGLVQPIDFDTEGLPLKDVIAKLPLPSEFPLRWSTEATELLAKRGDRAKFRQELNGFTTGLTMALGLSENGLGFRPNRTPSGVIELVVEPQNAKLHQWPIGWPLQRASFKAAPKLFAMVPIELSDAELSDVITAISELSETPILIDYGELDAKQIDLEKIKVFFPRKMTSWSLALRQIVVPNRLTQDLWQDEAGRAFVWVTTTRAGVAKVE